MTPELLDQLLANYEKPEDLTGDDGPFKQLKRALIERALGAELCKGWTKGSSWLVNARGIGKLYAEP
jgi:putative transposase